MKPNDFFIGVLDFFAILLPGAITTAILAKWVGPRFLGSLILLPTSESGEWAVFLACVYFLGHLLR